ncbi:MAG: hypothetical protein M3Y13_02770 [Armatimonadota bacterium]|nr:hypothetical protein [Armatimonadota bacterium]
MKTLDEQAVIETVRKYVKDRHPGEATLEILTHGIRQDQEWWYVPIRPSIQPAHRYEYYETLANIETELEKAEHLTVLLVPTTPEPIQQKSA